MEQPFVERDRELAELHRALAAARAGNGGVLLVAGEAGVGKSTLLHAFAAQAAGRPRIVTGGCDPLSLPRPLGPLIDAVGIVDAALARRLSAGTTRAEAFAAALHLVDGNDAEGAVTILVIEDAHWADEATLDMITFLGRRLADRPALMIVTYRDDEVGHDHPLRVRLGELSAAVRARIRLAPLSVEAVATLVGDGTDAAELHRMTGGNPFFVTEVLGDGGGTDELPESVRDAVLARAARLPHDARAVLDSLAVLPGRAESELIDVLVSDAGRGGLDVCVARGLLVEDATGGVTFRHELARRAVLDALPAGRRRALHGRILHVLTSPGSPAPDVARVVFHAVEAGDGAAVARHAPVAADEAAAVGAHRNAARHLDSALRDRSLLEPAAAAALLMRLGAELVILGDLERAVEIVDEAHEIFVSLGDVEAAAEALIAGERPLVTLGRVDDAIERVRRAEASLTGRPPSRAAALVPTSLLSIHMLARQFDDAEAQGRAAIRLGEAIGDRRIVAEACIQSGVAAAMNGNDDGLGRIHRGIDLARAIDDDALVALGYAQIGSGFGELRRYDVAVPALRDGLVFADAREIVRAAQYMRAWLARCELERGRWDDASAIAGALARNPRCVGVDRFVALVTLGWLRGRRGDPGAIEVLDEALALARSTRHVQRLWPVAACRAEVAWSNGRLDDEMELVDEIRSVAATLDYRPAVDELSMWRWIHDGTEHTDPTPGSGFALTAAGHPAAAAECWDRVGCPFEAAFARFLTGEPALLSVAHAAFAQLGATPMRLRTAEALRAAGADVPRIASAATRDNPSGLTRREMEVLAELATGATNREIAARLHLSIKTVGHHVSHVLEKLDVHTRTEAAVMASRLGSGATQK